MVNYTIDEADDNSKPDSYYSTVFGTYLAMPEWEALATLVCLSAVILTTVIGNILVIELNPHFYIECKIFQWMSKA